MTQVIKIYLPSESERGIGEVSAAVRDQVLKSFENGQISYSFSSNRVSGYVMIYPTQPLLSIRISNHTSQGGVPEEVLFAQDGKITTINAEMASGKEMMDAFIVKAILDTRDRSRDVKYLLNQHNML